ncbi:MAG TPA: hypothetical protein VJP79_09855 [Nitrososphaera sp.]|nr:hypothetical protein [Nitrososphaera sp.]
MESASVETKRAFGFLFVCVSVSVTAGAVLSEVAYLNASPLYVYALIWLGSFGAVFGAAMPKFRKVAPAIRGRMKTSTKWSTASKALNGICWAGPFLAIAVFPNLYQYLILLGIGLGNLSTYFLIKKNRGGDNREQLIVASVSLVALPVALMLDTTILAKNQDVAVMLSRILIAISYAAGGLFALAGEG